MKLTNKRFWKFETIIGLCSLFPVIVMVLVWPMDRDNTIENLTGYAIAYITSLGLNSLGGIIAWKLSKERTHWLLFAFYQWIAHMASITLVLVSISVVDSIFFADRSLPLAPNEMSDNEIIVIILYLETLIFACPILASSYLANKLGKRVDKL